MLRRAHTALARRTSRQFILTPPVAPTTPKKILFVGNSFTFFDPVGTTSLQYYNNANVTDLNNQNKSGLGGVFKAFTTQVGLDYTVSIETEPGSGLDYHYNSKLSTINKVWDRVVLQTYSTLDNDNPGNPAKLLQFSSLIANALKATNPAVVIDLQATWSRADLVYSSTAPWGGTHINKMGEDVHAAYVSAKANNANINRVIPVGLAWNRAFDTGVADTKPSDGIDAGKVKLWANDNYHGSAYGYYLSALTVFGAITGIDPRILGSSEPVAASVSMTASQATSLQQAAYDTLIAQGYSLAATTTPTPTPAPSASSQIVRPGVFNGTFARASSASNLTSDGGLVAVGSNVARFSGPAQRLLVEGQRSNTKFRSDRLGDQSFSWTFNRPGSVSNNSGVAPDGTNTAQTVNTNGFSSSGLVFAGFTTTSGTRLSLSGYFKAVSGDLTKLTWGVDANKGEFNLLDGTAVSVGTDTIVDIKPIGNGWFRCSTTFTTASSSIALVCYAGVLTVVSFLAWGITAELAPFASSYIATPASSAVTRAADVATYALTGDQQTQGTIIASVLMDGVFAPSPTRGILLLDNGTTTSRFGIRQGTGGSASLVGFREGGAGAVAGIAIGTADAGTVMKLALAWDADGFYCVKDGSDEVAVLGAPPAISQILLGHDTSALTGGGFVEFASVDLHSTRLSTAQMQSLTT